MISNVNSMCRNSKFCLIYFFFLGIEMPFTEKEKVFCVLKYTQSNKTEPCAFVREFTKNAATAMQI